jgi:hypothetical protein
VRGLKEIVSYGTISSFKPERKRIGSSVIVGRKVSDAQT